MKQLTHKMKEMLMECHERELLKQEPCSSYLTQVAKGLVTRGYFRADMHVSNENGKRYMAFFVTDSGKEYLKKYAG